MMKAINALLSGLLTMMESNFMKISKLDINNGYHKRFQNEGEELLMVNVGKVHTAHFKGFWCI